MSSADVKPKKIKKSKGAFGKDGQDPRVAAPEPSAPVEEEAAPKAKKEKKDKKRKAEEAPVAESSTAVVDDEAAKKEKKRLKKEKKALAAASSSSTTTPAPAPTATASLTTGPLSAASLAYLAEHSITVSHPYTPLLDMATLPISAKLAPALKEFAKPTPIQACSWPALFAGKDVVGVAETGSGKTLGFGIPAMQHLLSLPQTSGRTAVPSPSILVVSPTRELALQTSATLTALCTLLGFKSVCLFGGMPKGEQVALLRQEGLKVVVGTPGRVLDLVNDGAVSFEKVTYLVLDEADRMLDKGFENDIRQIIGYCPVEGRQTLMFSATWPESVRQLANTFMKTPVRITVGSDELSANSRVEQNVEVFNTSRDKDPRLLSLLRSHSAAHTGGAKHIPLRILVFALYKKEATRLEQTIRRAGFKVAGLHGDMGQKERMAALEGFVSGEVGVLVATDVAARGLDIPDVSLVINVTFPLTVEDYIHRIGRTGRGGKLGKSVTFFTGENHETALAGEFMRVLRDAGVTIPEEMGRFPSTIKKREHGSYGAFFKDIGDAPAAKKIKFD
ncbi:P-loop containing nucleoside triphosphate hydrolase protein [Mrakia frigida]|uniref:RNA-dependent ATPase DBP3 n=1 Tax=Mrakia frigida TaxID=29902 RepID=UPI003FCC0772